jgi:hypothetical protein
VVEAGQVSRRRPVGGRNDVKWRIRLIFASPQFGDWQKVTPKLSGGLFAKRRNIIDLAVAFHPRKDHAPAGLWFSKSIFRFHDPSFCCLVSVIRARGAKDHPWSNSSLSADERASMVVKEMTLEEKISLLHGTGRECRD